MKRAHDLPLEEGWQLARSAPAAFDAPGPVADASLEWRPARVPGTVAAALHDDWEAPGGYDEHDWWYRTAFAAPAAPGARHYLRFDGLATLARAWLNGSEILASTSMFARHRVDVTALVRDANQLVIRFASLKAALAQKRPRPRWKTALVREQNLRWFRTTFLGRMPGWTPAIDPVGPWQPVTLESVRGPDLASLAVHASVENGRGRVRVRAAFAVAAAHALEAARLCLGSGTHSLSVDASRGIVEGEAQVPDAPLWWPHTHGTPTLVDWALEVRVAGEWQGVEAGRTGFRALQVDESGGGPAFRVNGVPVFCRGACWTTLDIRAPGAAGPELRLALERARDAGVNMLRVGGTMVYESDAFYRLCDELGILVWQDFMFANLDYPMGDAVFRADVEREITGQLDRLHRHPCIAAYCGGSEVAQQAAMMGLPEAQWTHDFFRDALRAACALRHPGVAYFPSTPWGGALPFHVGTGVAHYYGVGAYRRPLGDVRLARVKFTTECLGFSNLPEPEAVAHAFGTASPPPHHPRWKARVPRDAGAGWDFEDVRDHYLEELFGTPPVRLRSADLERYHDLSRVVPGELMQRVFSEWRSPASGCGGALVWHYRDVWPGAGWGITDSDGHPKAAYWYLKRAWAPRAVCLTDEGLDGLAIHVLNDSPRPLTAIVELAAYLHGRAALAPVRAAIDLRAHGARTLSADALLGRFTDIGNVYRFGPPKHDVVAVRLLEEGTGESISEDFHFPAGHDLAPRAEANVRAWLEAAGAGPTVLNIESDAFLQAVSVAGGGWMPRDNYFHVAPGRLKRVVLDAGTPGDSPLALRALNFPRDIAVQDRPGTAQTGAGASKAR